MRVTPQSFSRVRKRFLIFEISQQSEVTMQLSDFHLHLLFPHSERTVRDQVFRSSHLSSVSVTLNYSSTQSLHNTKPLCASCRSSPSQQ
jgi:hypothetical protein